MKKILLVLLLSTFYQSASAQAALFAMIFGDKVATENFNVGLEVGFPFANLSEVEGKSGNIGIHFGISANMKLDDNWSLHPSAYFLSRRGVDLDELSLNSGDAVLNGKFQNVPAQLRTGYIDVPVFLNYRFTDSNFKVGIAPQVSFRTSSDAIFTNDQGDFEYDISDQTHTADFGLIAQVGYIWTGKKKDKEVHVHLRYYQGFSDVYEDALIAGNNEFNYLSLSLSFPFVKKDHTEE